LSRCPMADFPVQWLSLGILLINAAQLAAIWRNGRRSRECCATCKWYARGVCGNGESFYKWTATERGNGCDVWKGR
jgi:hypothetical protein